ncbi:MAG: CBS domain-containing protein [Actinomycetota bacterium]
MSFILVRRGLSDTRVRDLMNPEPVVVSPALTINGFFQEASRPGGHSAYPVIRDGQCIGLVSLRLAGSVPPEQRDRRTVAEIMMKDSDVPILDPDTPMLEALERLRLEPGRAVVLDGGRVIGVISVSDVTRTLEVEAARGSSSGQAPGTLGTRRPRRVWLGAALVIASVAAYLYHPPMAVISPGPAVDISRDATISGVPTQTPNGRYLLTSVRLSQPNALGAILAWLDPSQRVLPVAAFIPPGVSHGNFVERQRTLFRDSQMQAAAAAARAAGLEVSFDGTGAEVVAVMEGSPASDLLEPGDVLVEIEDRPIRLASQTRDVIGSRPPGTEFRLRFERSGSIRSATLRSAKLSQDADAISGIGVYLATRDIKIDLPFQVEFRERDIGGPSAGLAYALALADILDPDDLARGRTIAATGTIDVTGRVGPVGAVQEKAEGAKRAGAKVFLVPTAETRSAGRQNLKVRGVTTLDEALSALDVAS